MDDLMFILAFAAVFAMVVALLAKIQTKLGRRLEEKALGKLRAETDRAEPPPEPAAAKQVFISYQYDICDQFNENRVLRTGLGSSRMETTGEVTWEWLLHAQDLMRETFGWTHCIILYWHVWD